MKLILKRLFFFNKLFSNFIPKSEKIIYNKSGNIRYYIHMDHVPQTIYFSNIIGYTKEEKGVKIIG